MNSIDLTDLIMIESSTISSTGTEALGVICGGSCGGAICGCSCD